MPAVCRLGDSCTGHGGFPSRVNDSASTNVIINGVGAHRVGDHWVVHCDQQPSCHDSVLASGSGTVFVNGQSLGRIGDSIACGSTVASGSGNVFAGWI